MKKILLIVILVIAGSGTIYAQQVSGKITIKTTETNGHPIPFANVLLRKAKDSSLVKGELSSQEGSATFDKVEAGRYFIQANLMGYTNASTSVFSIDAQHKLVQLPTLTLSPASKTLEGVTVSAQKPFIERKNGATVLNVESSLAASGGTALDVLKRAPGVQIDKDDNVILQGNQGATIMLDGKLTYLSGEQLANLLRSLPTLTKAVCCVLLPDRSSIMVMETTPYVLNTPYCCIRIFSGTIRWLRRSNTTASFPIQQMRRCIYQKKKWPRSSLSLI
ncbi:peptidase associated/transthyretin-like domain-containing protein [Chitinophaga pinensis]|uniref:hypothetical protein n=1 Tax=Chitinophaga pinensis TaxID=79329 RepID=UPI0001A2E8F9